MRQRLFGVPVDNLSLAETLDRVEVLVRSRRPHRHVAMNVDKLVKVHRDPTLRRIVEGCDIINVDGQPLVWASRAMGAPIKERVAGIDLMEALVARSAARGWKVFFLGGEAAAVTSVVQYYQTVHPALRVAGWRDGYWDRARETDVVQDVRHAGPDILFVALGSPEKEHFIERHLRELAVPFVMGVGGAFDVVAGLTRRAPQLLRRLGLEWFWRFLQEPRRMWKRYFIDDIQFIELLARELWSAKVRRR